MLIITLSPVGKNTGTFAIIEMEVSLSWFSSSTGTEVGPVDVSGMIAASLTSVINAGGPRLLWKLLPGAITQPSGREDLPKEISLGD